MLRRSPSLLVTWHHGQCWSNQHFPLHHVCPCELGTKLHCVLMIHNFTSVFQFATCYLLVSNYEFLLKRVEFKLVLLNDVQACHREFFSMFFNNFTSLLIHSSSRFDLTMTEHILFLFLQKTIHSRSCSFHLILCKSRQSYIEANKI